MIASAPKARVLVVDDDPLSLELVAAALESDDAVILTAGDPREGLRLARECRPEIVVTDLMMPGMSGMDLLSAILEIDPAAEVILVTAHYSTESAVEAIRRGAADYFNKPVDVARLQNRVAGMVESVLRMRRARRLDSELAEAYSLEGMIGRNPLMLDLFARVRRVAPHFRTALVTGPSGSGKELVARSLHNLSPRAAQPFVVCNCASLTESLADSTLFGHMRGSFTGAVQDKVGLFEAAHGGTLFLDEIGEMPLATQAKLLRAVQQQEVLRIGANTPRKVDVRIVAATNRDLAESIRQREFREDLYFRLSMVHLMLPGLAARPEDLPLLIPHLLRQWSAQSGKQVDGVDHRAMRLLGQYHWPGNVRELENVLAYAAMMTTSETIGVRDLPENFNTPATAGQPAPGGYPMVSLEAMRGLHARKVLEALGGDKTRTAEVLGVSRATLYRLIAEADGTPAD